MHNINFHVLIHSSYLMACYSDALGLKTLDEYMNETSFDRFRGRLPKISEQGLEEL